MINPKFRTRILLVTVLPVIATALILASILISGRIDEFNKQTVEKGNNIANYISLMSEYGVFANNFSYLEATLTHTINQQDIVAIYIRDANNSPLLKKLNGSFKKVELKNINTSTHKVFTSKIVKTSLDINDIENEPNETTDSNPIVGTVNIIMSLRNANILKEQIIRDGIFTTLILTLVTIFIALIFSRSVTKPINQIYKDVNIIKQGDLKHRIPVNFSGELAVLAEAINNMTSSLEIAQSKEILRTEALLEAKEEAERANKAQSLFISSMSHEMRTPMNAILGFTQLLEIDTKDELTKDNIQEIMNAGNHLLTLIDDLLELSQLESGKIKLFIDSYSLNEIIDFSISMVQPSAKKMSVRIDNKVDRLPNIDVNVDAKRIKQIIINLLSNAVKYNNENGSVVIDYSIENEKMLRLSFTDTGKGIATQYHDNIYAFFDRAGQECSNISGSGLGLGISKKLIEIMNGAIGFESTEGEGSHFWITIPIS